MFLIAGCGSKPKPRMDTSVFPTYKMYPSLFKNQALLVKLIK